MTSGSVDFSPMVQVCKRKEQITNVYPEIAFGRVMWADAGEMASLLRELARAQLLLAARSSEVMG